SKVVCLLTVAPLTLHHLFCIYFILSKGGKTAVQFGIMYLPRAIHLYRRFRGRRRRCSVAPVTCFSRLHEEVSRSGVACEAPFCWLGYAGTGAGGGVVFGFFPGLPYLSCIILYSIKGK
ncbi:unnamed protein product, partial [Ixodes hexagonus]